MLILHKLLLTKKNVSQTQLESSYYTLKCLFSSSPQDINGTKQDDETPTGVFVQRIREKWLWYLGLIVHLKSSTFFIIYLYL